MPEIDPGWEVTVGDVKRMMDAREPFTLIDVREPEEHQLCRIPGAKLIPLGDIPNRLNEIRALADQGPLVLHCHHGKRSMNATVFLRNNGIDDVKSMAGGIDEWSVQVDLGVPRY